MAEIFLWYGLLALSHLFIQITFSHSEFLTARMKLEKKIYPSVAIVIPTYNEPVRDLIAGVKSCLNQDYKNLKKIVVVDDCSKRDISSSIKKIRDERLSFVRHTENKGKREAHKTAFDVIDKEVDIIVTVDSDAVLEKDALFWLVQKFQYRDVGAVTGNVRGKVKNFLSYLIDMRYWTAFNQERCSQSLFGTVLCCCGVITAYRSKLIRKLKKKYVTQKFMGKQCTFGDDRHLTNLILNEGFRVKYELRSVTTTSVPLRMKQWIKQQIRWNKSFYRELLWSIKMVAKSPRKLPAYIIYDLTMQTILPFLLFAALILTVFKVVDIGILALFGYLSVLIAVAWIRGLYALFRAGELRFLSFPLYAFLHIFILIPIRFYSIATLNKTHWGTR